MNRLLVNENNPAALRFEAEHHQAQIGKVAGVLLAGWGVFQFFL
jgi:hypothetical protein